MKKSLLKLTVLSLFAAAIVAAPVAARAESTNSPASGQENAKHKKHESETLPFHGKIKAVDKDAMTISVGERTFAITSETKITKDNVPATLSDAVVGEMVGGAYKKSAGGKLSATSVHLGLKPGEAKPESAPKKKKKSAEDSEPSTNSAAR
jgi:hypothetical protein